MSVQIKTPGSKENQGKHQKIPGEKVMLVFYFAAFYTVCEDVQNGSFPSGSYRQRPCRLTWVR